MENILKQVLFEQDLRVREQITKVALEGFQSRDNKIKLYRWAYCDTKQEIHADSGKEGR